MLTFTNPADIVADWLRMATVAQPKLLLPDEHTAAELQKEGLERQFSAPDRQLAELELRFQLGHIPSLALGQA